MVASTSTGSITARLIIVILAVCIGSNFQFYNNSVTSNLAELGQDFLNQSFHSHYGYYLTTSGMTMLWSFSTACLQIGCIPGAMVTRFLGDTCGRRKGLVGLSLVTALGATLAGFARSANSFELFAIGRFVMGFALGGSLPLASMFISEIAPVRYRGACGSNQHLFNGVGNLVSYIVTLTQLWGNEGGWSMAVSLPPFIAAMIQFLVLLLYAHDSPRALVLTNNNPDAGLKALRFYHGKREAEESLLAIKNEKRALEKGKKEEFRLIDVFRKTENCRPLRVALIIIFGSCMTGVTAVIAYSKTTFMQAGLDTTMAQYASVGLGLCNTVSPLLAMFLVERAGRKVIMIGGLLTTDMALIALTICLFGSRQYNWPSASLAAIPVAYVFFLGYGFVNSIVFIAPAELFPQKARASAMTVIFVVLLFLQTVQVMGYLPFSLLVGVCYSYTPYIFCITLSIILLLVFMPETKGKPVEQVAAMYAIRSPIAEI